MAIQVVGNGTFEQIGPARWLPSSSDLDRLIVPYQGYVGNLEAFQDALVQWQASDIDEDMFLSDWSSDGHPQTPTVDLIYIGKKGGVLPPARNQTGRSLQTVTYNTTIVDVGSLGYEFQYMAPTRTLSYISREEEGPDEPADPTGDPVLVFWRIGAITSLENPDVDAATVLSIFNTLFDPLIIPGGGSDEIVPGEYYRNTLTKTKIYQPS